MKFENEYKNALDDIKADGYIKQKVLNKISAPKRAKPPKKVIIWRAAAAVAACFAMAVSVFAIGGNREIPIKNNEKAQSYNDIYKQVKKFKPNIFEDFEYYVDMDGGEKVFEVIEDEAVSTDDTKGNSAKPGASNGAELKEDSYSETTAQVDGVLESDIVKTDGKYIYTLSSRNGKLTIIKAGKAPELVCCITVDTDEFFHNSEMYLYKDKLVIIGTDNKYYYNTNTKAIVYDVSNPGAPSKLFELGQSGNYNTSRVIDDKLYLISNYSIAVRKIDRKKIETYVPSVICEDYNSVVAADSIAFVDDCARPDYTVICGFSITDGSLLGSQSVLGGTYTVYCSTENIITAGFSDNYETSVSRYAISNGKINLKAQGKIEGSLLNQFSIDEYKGNFRFVTTISREVKTFEDGDVSGYAIENSNALFVLNGELKQIGAIKNLAKNERVYSVRFMGETAYFVTFRQVDPLFSADLSDPENPKIIGALKIPGFSNYLYPFGDGLLLGIGMDADERTGRTSGVKLSMFDISNPADVSEGSKIVLTEGYSEALYSHKAAIVNPNRNIIGFSAMGNNGTKYLIYSFEGGRFNLKSETNLGGVYGNIRGLYINDEFYIVTENSVTVLSLNDYTKIAELEFN